MTAEGLGPGIRVGKGPMRLPRGWAPKTDWGKAPCDRRGAGTRNPLGARPRATAEGLGPRIRVGQAPVRPLRGWATKGDWGRALCDR